MGNREILFRQLLPKFGSQLLKNFHGKLFALADCGKDVRISVHGYQCHYIYNAIYLCLTTKDETSSFSGVVGEAEWQ